MARHPDPAPDRQSGPLRAWPLSARAWLIGAGVLAALLLGAAATLTLFRDKEGDAPLAERGAALLAAGDAQGAVAALKAAYSARPEEETRLALARAMLATADFHGALELLEDERGAATPLRLEALVRLHRYDETDALAQAAAAELGGVAEYYRARAAFGRGEAERAREHLADALRKSSAAASPFWLFRAEIALYANDLDDARAAARRAADTGASAGELELVEIAALIRSGAFDAAQAALSAEDGAAADPRREVLRARLLAARGEAAEAVRTLRAVEAFAVSEPFGRLLLGVLLAASGETAQAEHALGAASETSPTSVEAAEALGALLLDTGRSDEAAPLPPAAAARLMLRKAGRSGDFDGVVIAAKSARGVVTADPVAFLLGEAAAGAKARGAEREGEDRLIVAAAARLSGDARAMRDEATTLERDVDPAARAIAGELRLALDDDAAARLDFERALLIAPDFTAAQLGRLRIDVRAGDPGAALARLEAALARRPGDVAIRSMLARALFAEGRVGEAAGLLASAEIAAMQDGDAALFVRLSAALGDGDGLDQTAQILVRNGTAGAATLRALHAAGRFRETAALSRAALLAAPFDDSLAAVYAAAMHAQELGQEGAQFLDELTRLKGAPSRTELAEALRGRGPLPEAVPPAPGLAAARAAFLETPMDSAAAYQYATALAGPGEQGAATRVLREACFLEPESVCHGGGGSE